jgi:hypothetical protein
MAGLMPNITQELSAQVQLVELVGQKKAAALLKKHGTYTAALAAHIAGSK